MPSNQAPSIGAFKSTYAITRVSTSAAGAQGNSDSFNPVFSPDGSKVAFISTAMNLVADDTNFLITDIFVKDLATGAITRISVGADGAQANSSSSNFVFSPDGGKIAFQSDASNLVAGDTGFTDIFVKDLATGAITLVSRSAAGVQGDYNSYRPVFSPDGGKIAFQSDASNLITGDTNHSGDIFVKDLATGEVTRVSVTASGDESHFGNSNPVFSPDGGRIAFLSYSLDLAGGGYNGNTYIIVKDLATGAISRVSVAADGTAANSWSDNPVFSPDGSEVAFHSDASNLVADDTNNGEDIFVKNLATGEVTQVSVGASGGQGNFSSNYPVFSPDGSKIAFVSGASNLVAGDTNNTADIFVKDLTTGAITLVSVDAAGAQGNNISFRAPVFSPDGSRIAFSSHASNFVAGDTNSEEDVFVKNLTPDHEDPAVYLANAAPVHVNTRPVTVSDSDNAAFGGGSLTAALTAGSHAGDALTLILSATPGTGIELSGATVSYNGIAIGILSGNGTGTLSVALNASAGVAAVEALAGAVGFSTPGDAPSADARTVKFTLVDGSGGSDTGFFTQTVLVPINTAPVLTTPGTGLTTTDFGSLVAAARSAVLQADGKIVVTGYAQGSVYNSELVRYNADGSIDTTFGNGGIVSAPPSSATGSGVAIQANGKIVTAGAVFGSSDNHFALARYNSNGSFDTSFGTGGKVLTSFGSTVPFGLFIQPDGKIVLAGGAAGDFAVARFNTDGSFDTSFGTGGKVTTDFGSNFATAYSVARTPDGKIVVAGLDEIVVGSAYDFAVVRYNADGSLDTSFGASGKVITDFTSSPDIPYSVTVQTDGKIVVSGITGPSSASNFALARYNVDGSLDASFGAGGKVVTDFGANFEAANSVTIQADGKIVVAGLSAFFGNSDFTLARYNSDGSLDTSFGTGGVVKTSFGPNTDVPNSVIVQPDGKIVVAGGTSGDYALARYNSDGSLDTSFGGQLSFVENGSRVVLNAAATVHDTDLDAAGSYAGATLMLVRHGGAVASDGFGGLGILGALTEGGSILLSVSIIGPPSDIGTVTRNSGGVLLLTFNANATEALVNAAIRNIGYANTSDNPPAAAQIDWTFSDGNSGAQGRGGALAAISSTTVNITSVNDAPVNTLPAGPLNATVNTDFVISGLAVSDADATSLTTVLHVAHGTLTVATGNAGVTGNGTATLTLSGTVAQINATLAAATHLTYHGAAGFLGTDNLTVITSDGGGSGTGGTMGDNDFVSITVAAAQHAAHDFNGDGKSDIVWRNDAGVTAIWDMNDTTMVHGNSLGEVPTNWTIAGTGDFNGDGKSDLLWRNDAGVTAIWDMNDGVVIGGGSLGSIPTNWHIAGTGDFNGDHMSDILWRNDAGLVAIWDMNDTTNIGGGTVALVPANWQIAGTGDFNGDQKSDILWRNDDGLVAIWDMNDTTNIGGGTVATLPANWHIAGTGDFNGDHHSDILLNNDAGVVAIWDMNDTAIIGGGAVATLPSNWHLSSTGDYNGDSKTDILLRNDAGVAAIWDMNDTTIIGGGAVATVPANWHIIA